MSAIEVDGLTKRFGTFVAVDHVHLPLKRERFLVCWGRTAPARQR